MKALMLKPEYVADILDGSKIEEYRTWSTDYRGDLLIGCTATKYSRGYLAALVTLTDCRYDVQEKIYVWQLENVRAIKPIAVTGKLRLFDVPVNPGDIVVIETDDEINAAYDEAEKWIRKQRDN